MSYNFLIIGGDKRIASLARKLQEDGNNIKTYGNEIEEIEEIKTKEELYDIDYETIISGVPISKDGINVNMPLSEKKLTIKEIKEIAKNKRIIAGNLQNIEGDDILKDEAFTILNTVPTAEGAIQIAMEETTCTLCGLKVLVLGFGRVGKTLCDKLCKMGVEVYCEARKEEDLAWIKAYGYKTIRLEDIEKNICKMDIIFNTIPSKILDKNKLVLMNKETLIVDLASLPGGVDYDAAKKLGIKAILALGLPGKVAPDTAADYIKEYVYRKLKNKN